MHSAFSSVNSLALSRQRHSDRCTYEYTHTPGKSAYDDVRSHETTGQKRKVEGNGHKSRNARARERCITEPRAIDGCLLQLTGYTLRASRSRVHATGLLLADEGGNDIIRDGCFIRQSVANISLRRDRIDETPPSTSQPPLNACACRPTSSVAPYSTLRRNEATSIDLSSLHGKANARSVNGTSSA